MEHIKLAYVINRLAYIKCYIYVYICTVSMEPPKSIFSANH